MNRKQKTYLWVVLTPILLVACQEQELPEEMTGTPDFYVEAQLGGQSLDLQAGIDDYYQFTGFTYDEEMAVFWGEFAPATCPDCPERLRIEVRDFQATTPGGPVDIDEALRPGTYDYLETLDGRIFRVQFTSEANQPPGLQYSWDFGDGGYSSDSNPEHLYFLPDSLPANSFEVCLETVATDGCVTTICNEINLDPEACKAAFTHSIDPDISNFVIFRSESTGTPPLSYRWDFGDGFTASLGNPGYYYGNVGLFTVCLTVRDANGCESVLCKNIAVDPAQCEANFSYVVESAANDPDTLHLSRVRVAWVDANGNTWESASQVQPASSYFEILSQEAYRANERGVPTRRLGIRLGCDLYREGDTLRLEAGEGFVGLGYP